MNLLTVTFVLLFLVKYSFSRAQIDYACPSTYCQCALLPNRLDAVQLICLLPAIREDFFDVASIPANYTTWLTISCQADLFTSHLTNETFSHLKNLEELLITDCVIPTIPRNAFSGLKVLIHLNITRNDDNPKPTIPEQGFLNGLDNLEVLNMPMAKIQNVPDGSFCTLRNLKHIELALNGASVANGFKCHLNSTEDSLLPNVTYLNLNSNGAKEVILEDFKRIVPNVQTLGLAANDIRSLANGTFQGLLHLKRLYLYNNPLVKLPNNIFDELTSLEILSLENTSLSTLNSDIFKYNPVLWLIILSNNMLEDTVFHGHNGGIFHHTPHLQLLDLSSNKISNISNLFSETPYLVQLDLGSNDIKQIPNGAFENLNMLQLLNLSRNPFESGELTRRSLSGLQQLEILDLTGCHLSTIPDDTFQETIKLTHLYLSKNHLTRSIKSIGSLSSLQSLDLNENKLTTIDRNDFSGLASLTFLFMKYNEIKYIPKGWLQRCPNVQEIYMEGNGIEEVEFGAFDGLNNLKILDLSNNSITDISIVLYFLPNLQYIFLNDNKITSINKWTFPLSAKVVFLQFNQISHIAVGTFSDLSELHVVHLEYNRLAKILKGQIRVFPTLFYRPHFHLAGNIITCDCLMSWILTINNIDPVQHLPYVVDLTKLRCNFNYSQQVTWIVDKDGDDYLCQWPYYCDIFTCDCCRAQQCHCKYICPTKCSCYRNQDSSLQIVDCSNRNLTVIPELPMIITVADLDGNEFGEIPALSFKNNSRLKILSLNNSNIEVIHDKAFAGLSGLQSLWLDNNIIQNVSSGAFFGLENVKNVSLHANSIETLKAGAFDKAKSLNNLTLHINKLKMVDLKTFMAKNVNLTTLTLSENPWLCNCSFGPGFQEWIRRKIKIIRDANDIECRDNETVETNNATDVRQSYDFYGNFVNESQGSNTVNETLNHLLYVNFSHCYPNRSKVVHQSFENKKAVIALSVSGCLFLLMLTVALSVYCSREIIKVCLYNRYGFRFNKQDERNDGKQFDAFVSYSQQDQKFVTKALVPKLEQKKPYYHLCLHYRDWPIGGAIAQTICESVEKSRRTIILLSENFMKSEWCQYEFKAAHYRVLHDKTIRIIMILLDDKPPQNLDPELKLYIKTNTYLEWKDPWFWEKLKYALPDVEREPRPRGRAYYQYMAGKPVNEDTERDQNIEDTDASDVSADTNEVTDSSESTSDIEECSVTDVGLTDSFELDEVRIAPNTATTTAATAV